MHAVLGVTLMRSLLLYTKLVFTRIDAATYRSASADETPLR